MIEAIKNRRSIRKYKNEAVDKEAIVQILQAGMLGTILKESLAVEVCCGNGKCKSGSLSSNGRGNQAREERSYYARTWEFVDL